MTDTTTIQITVEQKAALVKMGFGSHKATVQELLDAYESDDDDGVEYDDVKSACQSAIREELPERALQ